MDRVAGGGNVLILAMPFHHLHVLRQLRGAAQPRTPSAPAACPRGAVPPGPVLPGQGTAASPSRVDSRSPMDGECHGESDCVAATCSWKKNHGNRLGITVRRCCVSQVIRRGGEKAKQSRWEGENAGKWSSVIVEVSGSCEKRGKKAGKSPVCGFGDIRKVVLRMDVH